ncbi:hypothetical protein GA0115236_10856 [Streptomyces sp. IgraMP-1]|nr:hypothetical protein GA0115236_10856 [Streptomyces sp. IgraMP-1]
MPAAAAISSMDTVVGGAVAEQLQRNPDELLPPLLDTHSAARPGRHTEQTTDLRESGVPLCAR